MVLKRQGFYYICNSVGQEFRQLGWSSFCSVWCWWRRWRSKWLCMSGTLTKPAGSLGSQLYQSEHLCMAAHTGNSKLLTWVSGTQGKAEATKPFMIQPQKSHSVTLGWSSQQPFQMQWKGKLLLLLQGSAHILKPTHSPRTPRWENTGVKKVFFNCPRGTLGSITAMFPSVVLISLQEHEMILASTQLGI